MKLIVVVCVPPAEAGTAAERAVVVRERDFAPSPVVRPLPAIEGRPSIPPFWTWFIENPRPVEQGVI